MLWLSWDPPFYFGTAYDTSLTRTSTILQVNMDVEVRIVGDMLKGDDVHELRLKLKEHRNEEFPYKDDEWVSGV